jgi:hypothetical protein
MDQSLFQLLALVWLGIALVVHVLLFFVTAPFGRYSSERWGPTINNKAGWILMELPSLAIMAWFLTTGSRSLLSGVWILFALWLLHYANRTLVYPLRIRATPKRMPVAIVGSGFAFNTVNALMNGWYLAELAPAAHYGPAWLGSPGFALGLGLFFGGMAINWIADSMLIRLRHRGETGYGIPRGFLFEYVAAPNLLGEIIEWAGFAVLAWNLPALCFLAWTCANLVPRARNHRDWYRRSFPDFPRERKILIPFIF